MKKDYMTRLERAARWRLPRQEAEDVIADYRDIVNAQPRSDAELLRDLGKPHDVVRPLAQSRQYRTWLIVFAVMAACIALPALGPWPFTGLYLPELFGDFPTWELYFRPLWDLFTSYRSPFPYLYFAVGLAVALVWFRRPKGERKSPLPRATPALLAALAVPLAVMLWLLVQLDGFPDAFLWQFAINYRVGPMITLAAVWVCFAMAILGVIALVKARTADHRWRAVYAMALTAVIVCLSVLAVFTNMSIDFTSGSHPLWDEVIRCFTLTIVGLIGTGVSLC